jgi:hypothetical protein
VPTGTGPAVCRLLRSRLSHIDNTIGEGPTDRACVRCLMASSRRPTTRRCDFSDTLVNKKLPQVKQILRVSVPLSGTARAQKALPGAFSLAKLSGRLQR